ncbi:MAG: LytTR family DNA-binding domain-containing protein [Bacteroidota bacterium]
MKVLILDDEINCRETLISFLQKSHIPDLEIKEAENVQSAVEVLNVFKPDLALLDINLGDGTSFDVLNRLQSVSFKIIFISAYDDYAIKAFKYNALDYILKPINPIEFKIALEKIRDEEKADKRQLRSLSESLDSKELNKLVLKDTKAIHFVRIEDIIQCRSESNYTVFSLIDSSEIVISKTLAEYDTLLKGRGFFRTHRSHLINLHHIKKYDKREGGYIEMTNTDQVPLARNKKEIFMQVVNRL